MSKQTFESKISAALGRIVHAENIWENGREVLEIRANGYRFRPMNGKIAAQRIGSRNWLVGVAA